MKKLLQAVLFSTALITLPAFGHHAAEGVVDEEVYAMIDELLADSAHADMTIDEIAVGMTETTITTRTINQMENLIDDGLLDYAAMLDAEVNITFETDGSVIMTITQTT